MQYNIVTVSTPICMLSTMSATKWSSFVHSSVLILELASRRNTISASTLASHTYYNEQTNVGIVSDPVNWIMNIIVHPAS